MNLEMAEPDSHQITYLNERSLNHVHEKISCNKRHCLLCGTNVHVQRKHLGEQKKKAYESIVIEKSENENRS